MSDNIPFDLQVEIMKRLPSKSLIQFLSVSKPWKSLIDSSEFIANYHRTQPQHHLLVSYIDPENESERKCVSIADDDTFPKQMFSPTVPESVKQFNQPKIVTSQGLLCLYNVFAAPDDSGTKTAVIWNPTIMKSVTIAVPVSSKLYYRTVVGFGVCPNTCDPKLVKITFHHNLSGKDTIVEVFSLSTMAWRRLTTNLPRKSIAFTCNNVAIDRFIYWNAFDTGSNLIMSFDMITEEFRDFYLPDSLALDHESALFVFKVNESLVVAQLKYEDEKLVVSVWMMEHGDPRSFTKQFTINTPNGIYGLHGFRNSGEPLIEMRGADTERGHLGFSVYELCSGHMNSIGITAIEDSCYVNSYIETLLLLDH